MKDLLLGRLLFLIVLVSIGIVSVQAQDRYAVVVGKMVTSDRSWDKVTDELKSRYQASVIEYSSSPDEALAELQKLQPRYVAFVEKPENIGIDYILRVHRMSRKLDEDIYADFIWGIVTGADAESAMRLLEESAKPLVIRSALSTTTELGSGKWFSRYALTDPEKIAVKNPDAPLIEQIKAPKFGFYAIKKAKTDTLVRQKVSMKLLPDQFYVLYRDLDPDLIFTIGEFYQNKMLIRPRVADRYIYGKNAGLYQVMEGGEQKLPEGRHARAFLALGSRGGDIGQSAGGLPVAWLSYGNVAALVGYTTSTWHGQAGWGTWKMWSVNPGQYTLAEAMFLNQQYMLDRLNKWSPRFPDFEYPYLSDNLRKDFPEVVATVEKVTGMSELSLDQMGYLYDKDILAYYGDPKWNVRLDTISSANDYDVKMVKKGKKCIVTITTSEHFSRIRMEGDYFKEEGDVMNPVSIGRLPFTYFFSERLRNPRLAGKLKFDGELSLNKDFLFIQYAGFEPGKTYRIVLKTD